LFDLGEVLFYLQRLRKMKIRLQRGNQNLKLLAVWILITFAFQSDQNEFEKDILYYHIDPKNCDIQLYWKDDEGQNLKNLGGLKQFVASQQKELLFGMNAGMFQKDLTPQGLYIQNFETLFPLDTTQGKGNFYLKPNGVFYIKNDRISVVCTTEDFKADDTIQWATQSGPMLLIDGVIHPAFKQGSQNVNIRNGVGILPDHSLVFAMSKNEINFYDFALFFKSMGCTNALYLDGLISKTYLPKKHSSQTDGWLGVMIGVVE